MKGFFAICAALWLAVFTLPVFIAASEPQAISAVQTEAAEKKDAAVEITLWDGEKVQTLALDEYLCGVVAAEMPALFPEQALRAQAVAARTYAMRRASASPAAAHRGAMLCANAAHCKAYRPIAEAAANWGISRDAYTEKISAAVADTDGQILLYEGEPISAVFHSASSGKTERAADVWGGDVPYLQSVESPGEQEAPNYHGTVEIACDEFRKRFSEKYGGDLTAPPERWFAASQRSAAGGVITVHVGGVKVTGEQVRTLCGLRSANFTVRREGDKLVFDTVGYGHGVGMSQYGARAMAQAGKDYREILSHYYRGVEFGMIG